MVQRLVVILFVMMVLVGLVRADDVKEVITENAEGLKGIKAKKITWKKDGAKMVLVKPDVPAQYEEKKTFDRLGNPMTKKVKVSDASPAFWMDATEVTVGQFKKFLKSTDYKFDGELWGKVYQYSPTDKHPMIQVTWHDAVAYAKWARKRLPTEKEWKFAAKGSLVGKEYSWGDDVSVASDYAHYDSWNDGKGTTKPVGSFKPNGYGLFDMSGNVWEWCEESGVLRGGSWFNGPYYLRMARRRNFLPTSSFNSRLGFRCVSGLPAAQ